MSSSSTLPLFVSSLALAHVACVTPLSASRGTDAMREDASSPSAVDAAPASTDAGVMQTDAARDAVLAVDAATDLDDVLVVPRVDDAGAVPADAPVVASDTSAAACAPLVFEVDAPFTATESDPIRRTDFDIDDGLVFGRIDVELDFVRGPWASAHPDGRLGMHNVFWLHRGLRGNHWLDNSVGYLNFTAATQMRLETNLGITDESVWSDVLSASRCATTEGERYHLHYVYDAAGRRWWFELSSRDGEVICRQEDVPILTEIVGRSPYSRGASAFFIELGHIVWTPEHEGPEVATLGWTYSNVEVRFSPLGCP